MSDAEQGLTPDELEEADGEALPDREALSVVDPTGGGNEFVLLDEIPPPPLAD